MPTRFASSIVVLLVALTTMMSDAHAQSNTEEIQGIQTIGDRGITQTVASLMRAQAQRDARDVRPEKKSAADVAHVDEKSGGIAGANVTLGLQFDAIRLSDTTFVRPNESMDVGPTQALVISDGRLRSFEKQTGTADGVLDLDPSVLFASVLPAVNAQVFDQHIRFDRATQRWFIMASELPRQAAGTYLQNRSMIAVSSGATISNATQFTFFWFQPAIGSTIADLPSLGMDANALYVGVNRFHNVSFTFVAADVHVIRKASLLGAGPIVVTTFVNFAAASFSPVGVDNPDPAPMQGYIVAESSSGAPALWRVSDPGGTPSLSAQLAVSGGFTSEYPTVVPQPGTSTTLQIGRSDLRMASIRNGRLWVAHHVGVNASGTPLSGVGARTAVRWYEITDLSTAPAVRQSGLMFDSAASNPRHYFIPSLAISGQGHTFFGFNTGGANEYTNAAASVRWRDDALGTSRTPTPFSASQHAFSFSGGPWGSRSRTVIDADDDMSAWTVQQYVSATNVWTLRVAKLRAPPPPNFLPTPTTVASGSTTNITLNATSTANGEGYFDPGPGFIKRLQVTLPGFTVNSVQYLSPTQIVVNATANAGVTTVSGALVINPDGQRSAYGSALRSITVVAENGFGGVTDANYFPTPCTGSCTAQVPAGSAVSLIAAPTMGGGFSGWTTNVPGLVCGTSATCNIVVNENTTMYATFRDNSNFAPDLNVDQSLNGPQCRITSDGAMIVRFLRGMTNNAIAGAGIPADAAANALGVAKGTAHRKPLFDVDGNGVADAATDGVLILRYFAGFRDAALIANAIGAQATRTTSAAVTLYLDALNAGVLGPCAAR
jgi:hypothetical protein